MVGHFHEKLPTSDFKPGTPAVAVAMIQLKLGRFAFTTAKK
jgi:hypothetical protein